MKALVFFIVFLLTSLPASASCWRAASQPSAGGQFPHVQLWNASLDRYLVVSQVIVGCTGCSWVYGRTLDPLPPVYADPRGISNQFDLNTDPCEGEIRGADGMQLLGQMVNNVGSMMVSTDFIIPPGFGVTIRGGEPGATLRGTFHWDEVPCDGTIC